MSKTVGLLFFSKKQNFSHSYLVPFHGPWRQTSEGALATRSALKDLNQNWPSASHPGVDPPPVVRGAPIPVHYLCRTGLRAPSKKNFRVFCPSRAVFQGCSISEDPRKLRCSAKAPSCSVSHLLRRSSRRILFACIFKVHKS